MTLRRAEGSTPDGPAPEEEAMVVIAFRRRTMLPLNDCLYALRATIPRPARPCIDTYSGTASADYQSSPATRPAGNRSNAIRSATSTSTSPR